MDVYTLKNPLQACLDVLFKPNKVFAALSDKNNWSWVPFIIVAILGTLPMYMYLNTVDMNWYVDLQVNATLSGVSPAEQQNLRDLLLAQNTRSAYTIVAMVAGLIITNAFFAYYLKIATRSDERNVNGFAEWYGFSWWTQLPVVITALSALLVIGFASTDQLMPGRLNVTSLGYILGVEFTSSWFALAQSIKLETIWSIYLIATGLNQWTNLSPKRTMLVAAGPYAVIWGVWTLFLILT